MSLVRINVHEHTGTIILNRPERRNALSRDTIAELVQALSDLHQERRVRAVVLTGAGSSFCAIDLARNARDQAKRRPVRRSGAKTPCSIWNSSKSCCNSPSR